MLFFEILHDHGKIPLLNRITVHYGKIVDEMSCSEQTVRIRSSSALMKPLRTVRGGAVLYGIY